MRERLMKINLGSCIKLKVLFLALSILTFAGVVYASENQVWIEADGEASMGEIETQKEVKERAKIDAYLAQAWTSRASTQFGDATYFLP